MSEPNTRVIELEAALDEERRQHGITRACLEEATQRLERANVGIAEVESRALEHAALEFRSPENAWVRAYLYRMAMLKRTGARS